MSGRAIRSTPVCSSVLCLLLAAASNAHGAVLPAAPQDFYISLTDVDEVRRLDGNTGILHPFASGMRIPFYGEWGADGFLYMPDIALRAVWKIAPDGTKQLLTIGGFLEGPITVAIDPAGDLYVSDSINNVVVKVDPITGAQSIYVDNSSGLFNGPGGLGFDLDGNLYVGSVFDSAIIKVDSNGVPSLLFQDLSILHKPGGVQADGSGNLFVSSYYDDWVVRIRIDTAEATVWGSHPQMNRVNDLKLSNDGSLLVTCAGTPGLFRIGPDGSTSLVATDASFGGWFGVAVVGDTPRCDGRTIPYGTGTAGSGGFVPRFGGIYSPCPGANLATEIDRALGGAPAFVLWSALPASLPFSGGTLLIHPAPPWGLFPITLPGSGPGNGALFLPGVLPSDPASVGLSVYEQVLVADPGAPRGLAMSNGLEIRIGS